MSKTESDYIHHHLKAFSLNTIQPPSKQGLYDPQNEHDACGVGFIVHQKGQKSHSIVADALTILENLEHRGACGCEPLLDRLAGTKTANQLRDSIEKHAQYTDSATAVKVLANWESTLPKFVKVMPRDYKRVLHEHHHVYLRGGLLLQTKSAIPGWFESSSRLSKTVF